MTNTLKDAITLKKLFGSVSGAFGAIPGMAVLITAVGVPPGHRILFGGLVQLFGCLGLLLLYVNSGGLKQSSKNWVTLASICCAIGALICLVVYMPLLNNCVVTSKVEEHWSDHPVYFPLWLTDDTKRIVEDAGGRQAAVDKFGPGAIERQLAEMPGRTLAYGMTTTFLLILLLCIFTLLTIAFGMPAYHLNSS